MKIQNDPFLLFLVASGTVHAALFGLDSAVPESPAFSVNRAPNTVEVRLVRERPQPVVPPEPEEPAIRREPQPVKKSEPVLESRESLGAIVKAKPASVANPAPAYPRIARQRGWEGVVTLSVWVEKDGHPTKVRVEKSSGYGLLDEVALEAVRKWQFEAARSGEKSFASEITIPMKFQLED